jgi:hypothetical protein
VSLKRGKEADAASAPRRVRAKLPPVERRRSLWQI